MYLCEKAPRCEVLFHIVLLKKIMQTLDNISDICYNTERIRERKEAMANKCVAVLDIRSSEVAIFVGERGVNHTFVFKASKTEQYSGYQDGEFYDISELSAAILRALDGVEQICGEKIRSLYVGVPGDFTEVIAKEQVIGFPKRIKISNREVQSLYDSGRQELNGYRFIRVSSMIYETTDNRRVSDPTGIYATGLSGSLSYFYCSEYFAKTLENIFSNRKIALHFLPTQFAMSVYLIPAETRDEFAILLDVGYLSSTICILYGNGVVMQRSFWCGQGQIAVRLMQRFGLPFEAASALLRRANLYLRRDAKNREFEFEGSYYEIPTDDFIDEVKAGLDDLCEPVSAFLDACSGKELDSKPVYVTGEGLDGIRGAIEHLSKRLFCVCEPIAPNLPYYNKPEMSSRIALIDMAYEDSCKNSGFGNRFFNKFGG